MYQLTIFYIKCPGKLVFSLHRNSSFTKDKEIAFDWINIVISSWTVEFSLCAIQFYVTTKKNTTPSTHPSKKPQKTETHNIITAIIATLVKIKRQNIKYGSLRPSNWGIVLLFPQICDICRKRSVEPQLFGLVYRKLPVLLKVLYRIGKAEEIVADSTHVLCDQNHTQNNKPVQIWA